MDDTESLGDVLTCRLPDEQPRGILVGDGKFFAYSDCYGSRRTSCFESLVFMNIHRAIRRSKMPASYAVVCEISVGRHSSVLMQCTIWPSFAPAQVVYTVQFTSTRQRRWGRGRSYSGCKVRTLPGISGMSRDVDEMKRAKLMLHNCNRTESCSHAFQHQFSIKGRP